MVFATFLEAAFEYFRAMMVASSKWLRFEQRPRGLGSRIPLIILAAMTLHWLVCAGLYLGISRLFSYGLAPDLERFYPRRVKLSSTDRQKFRKRAMNGIIYLVGLVVVIMAILSLLGIH